MFKYFDNQLSEEWRGIISHQSDSLAYFMNSFPDQFRVTFPIRLFENDIPQLHDLSLFDFSD